ncbi:MAG: chromosome condensation regulator [Hyperionvirus sp.]|uniref:Chromosome condensation regulator n=1 Tax=Hyperionvirus sp. TaxID=2487770 RepID=A0A3G5ABM8_9VIRU|nr:MAG: chromosome condensation regulator [Hyperionvirus sp.]
MDINSLVKALPIDLVFIVTNYDPGVLFRVLGESELVKFDWFKLIRMNFSMIYGRDSCTNEEMMGVYLDNCDNARGKIACGAFITFVMLRDCLLGCGKVHCERKATTLEKVVYGEIKKKKLIGGIKWGRGHAIYRLMDGTLMGGGDNGFGQLGLGDDKPKKLLHKIGGIGKNIADVACGYNYTIVRLTDGTLMGCGLNTSGELGLGDQRNRYFFDKIQGIGDVEEVVCGAYHTIIRLRNGTIMGCGRNGCGQLGTGDYFLRKSFVEIGKDIAEVKCGRGHTVIRLTDGTLMGCGENLSGQLGFGDYKDRNVFEVIRGIPKNIAEITCVMVQTIIRLTDGTLMATGSNGSGQLGLGDDRDRNMFEEIKGIPKNIAKVISGFTHTIIQTTNGTLMSCGSNEYGQLGLGDYRDRNVFEKIIRTS